jgi:hypothetical protein
VSAIRLDMEIQARTFTMNRMHVLDALAERIGRLQLGCQGDYCKRNRTTRGSVLCSA